MKTPLLPKIIEIYLSGLEALNTNKKAVLAALPGLAATGGSKSRQAKNCTNLAPISRS